MMRDVATLAEAHEKFRWNIPERYNLGVDLADRWAGVEPSRLAILDLGPDGVSPRPVTFSELAGRSNRMANVLAAAGIGKGDRVGVLLPQQAEVALAHIALWKLGAISIPLFTLFGPDALQHRLADAGAVAVITDAPGCTRLFGLRAGLPDLRHVFAIEPCESARDINEEADTAADSFEPVDTAAEDPAVLIYTSGTTGPPKGTLHAHRVLFGHLPGVEISHDLFPQVGDLIWTPADWAWIGGLFDVLAPALHHGVPVIARRFAKFTGEAAFELITSHGVRNCFLPPTALKLMAQVEDAEKRWQFDLRSVASGGESLGASLIDWGRRVLGVTINEFYGQTECNMIVSSCQKLEPVRPGWIGRPVPGHELKLLREDGHEAAIGEPGIVAVRSPDPVMFLGYWNRPEATAEKFVVREDGKWLLTGDRAVAAEDGWLRFVGRDDDVINSAGYRIGPAEIEDCLTGHPTVSLAAAVGKPNPLRGEIVVAFVVLAEGLSASQDLRDELANWVKERLSAHEYPRDIHFVGKLPMTVTGKIKRGELRERLEQDKSGLTS